MQTVFKLLKTLKISNANKSYQWHDWQGKQLGIWHTVSLRMQSKEQDCKWLSQPPLVCAHGGDSAKAPPNTVGIPHVLKNEIPA